MLKFKARSHYAGNGTFSGWHCAYNLERRSRGALFRGGYGESMADHPLFDRQDGQRAEEKLYI
jgi:hypothetical protein